MSIAENSTGAARTVGRPFVRGASGNPGGRSKTAIDIQTLAQRHGPEAIGALAQALKSRNERIRVAAAAILLDRAYGKPAQMISTNSATSVSELHLLAAQLVSTRLITELEQHGHQPHVINGKPEPLPQDLLTAPPPEE